MNGQKVWRGAGLILYRTARSLHNTITRPGIPNWSIIITSRRIRPWAMIDCDTLNPIQLKEDSSWPGEEKSEGHWLLLRSSTSSSEKRDVPSGKEVHV